MQSLHRNGTVVEDGHSTFMSNVEKLDKYGSR